MERDPDQSAVTDLPFQVQTVGRAFGKTAKLKGYAATGAVTDETAKRPSRPKRSARKRLNQRALLRNWRRRYEQEPDTRLRKPPAETRIECPHVEVIWLERPHPRYGKNQPYFVPRVVPVEDPHTCVAGAA